MAGNWPSSFACLWTEMQLKTITSNQDKNEAKNPAIITEQT